MARSRRALLRGMVTVTAGGLVAGCTGGGGGDGGETPTGTPGNGVAGTPTEDPTTASPTDPTAASATPTLDHHESSTASRTATTEPTRTPTATETTPAATANGSPTVVSLVQSTFQPVRATIQPGETVRWVNEDSFAHNVTAARFHDAATEWSYTAQFSGGEQAERRFDVAGVYEYYCTIHGRGQMCGAILVGDVTLDAALPCE